jgi:hypothetical protein
MAIGPVQLIVLGFEHPEFHGEIIEELERLRESDTVRVIDALAVHKDAAGAPSSRGSPARSALTVRAPRSPRVVTGGSRPGRLGGRRSPSPATRGLRIDKPARVLARGRM